MASGVAGRFQMIIDSLRLMGLGGGIRDTVLSRDTLSRGLAPIPI
jgi:hypothetical protein